MPGIGPMELIVVLVIALLILGPKKLPGLGRSVGSGMRSSRSRSPAITTRTSCRQPTEPADAASLAAVETSDGRTKPVRTRTSSRSSSTWTSFGRA